MAAGSTGERPLVILIRKAFYILPTQIGTSPLKLAPIPLAGLLVLASLMVIPQVIFTARATHDPTDFVLRASLSGFNSTPTNPTVREFRGVVFTVTIQLADLNTHNIAIYAAGAVSGSPFAPCAFPCYARSLDVTGANPTRTLTFTPVVPPDDGSGLGGYEYYCEYHSFSMHGFMEVYKSPDIDGDGSVTILDISEMAFRFDTKAGDQLFMASSDLDNDADIDISDIALGAFYFDQVLVD